MVDVRVRLFDLVEKQDAIRIAAYLLGELPAFAVANVAGRRANHLGDGMALHVLAHVEPNETLFVVEKKLGESLRELRLADAGGPRER